MDRNVQKKEDDNGKEGVENVTVRELDWTELPDDKVIQLFSCLNHRDRASLSSTCRSWWNISKSPLLWQTLDLRFRDIDDEVATSLASRCSNLQKLRVRGNESVSSLVNLRAINLREISINYCTHVTNATLSILLAQHSALECIQIGPDVHSAISTDAIKTIALSCPNLKKLLLTGIRVVTGEAISCLAQNCRNLTDIGFIDCRKVDEAALGNVTMLRFLSIAGTIDINWNLANLHWSKLLNLTCLDVSRTNIDPRAVSEFLSSCFSLKVLCAMCCPLVEADSTSIRRRGKVLVGVFTDILKELATLFVNMPKGKGNVFLDRRYSNNYKDRELKSIMDWLECTICSLLLSVSERYTPALDNFWLHQGTSLLCSFLQSPHEEIRERATKALAVFAISNDANVFIDTKRTEAVLREDGIHFLVNLARSWQEMLQLEAVTALVYLTRDGNVAKAIIDEGGVDVLLFNAKSANKTLATEALAGLWNLVPYDENKLAFAKVSGIRVIVEVIVRWSNSNDSEGVLERATGALANLATYDKYSREIAFVGGVCALEPLLRNDTAPTAQEKAARCLSNMASHDESLAVVRQETRILEALVQLIRSPSDGVRQEATSALWSLSYDERNRDEIAAIGGVQALVALANSCENASPDLQERAAGALWAMSNSEGINIAIGQEGGVTPLIALAKSDAKEVHVMATGALWNLASNAGNVVRIIEEDGVPALIHVCSSSVSKLARFLSALALGYMFDTRLDELAIAGTSNRSTSKSAVLISARKVASKAIEVFLKPYSDPHTLSAVASLSPSPAAVNRVKELARIEDTYALSCSGLDIERFLTMLSHPSPIIKSCFTFALLQFTLPEGEQAIHHTNLLRNAGAPRILRVTAASVSAPLEAKAFARVVLRNLEHHQVDHSK